MTVKVHSGLCMKYSRWDIYQVNWERGGRCEVGPRRGAGPPNE